MVHNIDIEFSYIITSQEFIDLLSLEYFCEKGESTPHPGVPAVRHASHASPSCSRGQLGGVTSSQPLSDWLLDSASVPSAGGH